MPTAHAPQRGRLEAQPAQRRVQHEVVERDQQHHQQRVERLHLRRLADQPARPPRLVVGISSRCPAGPRSRPSGRTATRTASPARTRSGCAAPRARRRPPRRDAGRARARAASRCRRRRTPISRPSASTRGDHEAQLARISTSDTPAPSTHADRRPPPGPGRDWPGAARVSAVRDDAAGTNAGSAAPAARARTSCGPSRRSPWR